jgi:signal transduction histidine kinase
MVILVTLMHYNTAMHIHAAHGIYRRLYYFPIIIAAFRGGRRAGLATALAICVLYIPHAFGHIGHDPAPTLEKVLEMVLYVAVGLVTGILEDRDRRSRDRLRASLRERERLQDALVQRERLAAVGQLSAGLAHEVRNPLASIRGATEMLQDTTPEEGPRGRMLTIVREETARLNDVLTRFLAFARPGGDARATLDLGEELERLADLLRHRDHAPRIRVDRPDGPAPLEADRDRVRQMLLNLGLNAVQAAGAEGEVVLALAAGEDGWRIAVTDTGPGFGEEALRNLGTPFFTTTPDGSGLGVAISLRTARDHGGDLAVDTSYPHGARVVVTLPRTSQEERP